MSGFFESGVFYLLGGWTLCFTGLILGRLASHAADAGRGWMWFALGSLSALALLSSLNFGVRYVLA